MKTWMLAARPKTLGAAIAPVVMGSAMAIEADGFHLLSAVCCLLGALLIQIGANFANDYFDHAKGADTPQRIGPTRATQAGLVSPAAMMRATALAFALACVPGLYIVVRGGWPFVAIGLVSILCGVLYSGGPFPLGYLGLADFFVLVFFGPIAVGGTYYVQTHAIGTDALLAGAAAGLFSVAILTINNLRDIDEDRASGKRTLPVRFGRTFAKAEYSVCLVMAALVIPIALAVRGDHLPVLIGALVLPAAAPVVRTVNTRTDGPALNNALAATGKLLLVFSVLFSLGWLL
ncbi:MAG: 1,4-dihydroxy-2-naphthoate polyprenyltransferase [Nitrospiraceae bacterium]|nr:1,4-dihydroxy-2-naphthoate polyprenyltransferase [Nitrospiraceae bacterium]